MKLSTRAASMAGAARTIDASIMPESFDENIYSKDIYDLNCAVLTQSRNLAKIDISISSLFTNFSHHFLTALTSTPLRSIETATSNSVVMFKLKTSENSSIENFFNNTLIQSIKIRSLQKSMLFLIREAARNDIDWAQLISGLSVDELIILANQSNQEIEDRFFSNHFIFAYRGNEQALEQALIMPDSNNAKMIALAKTIAVV